MPDNENPPAPGAHTKPTDSGAESSDDGLRPKRKSQTQTSRKKLRPARLVVQARRYCDSLNEHFVEHRSSHGMWIDEARGGGLFQTVVALDALWTQGKILNVQAGYPERLLDEDIEFMISFFEGKPVEESFPLHAMEGKGHPSPEVAATVIRALIGTRQRMRKLGRWDAVQTRPRFEAICDRALNFLIESVNREDGGWSFLAGAPSRLYPTCVVVRSLGYILEDPGMFDVRLVQEAVPKLILGGRKYIEACGTGERYTNRVNGDAMDLYSANALLALETVHSHFPNRINFQQDIETAFDYYRIGELPPKSDQRTGALSEDLFVGQDYEQPDLLYRDNSNRWPWLHAVTTWIQCRPQFYKDEWQAVADGLLRFQLETMPTSSIYIWNSASVALNAYRRYSAINYRVNDLGLRKCMFDLFSDERMAQSAYEFVQKQILHTEIE